MAPFYDRVVLLYAWLNSIAKRYYAYNSQDSQDLASETALRLLEASNKFDDTRDIKPWACAIMRNTFITQRRRKLLIDVESLDRCPCDDMLITDNIDSVSTLAYIKRLSMADKNVKCLMFLSQGFSYSDISDLLGIPIGTVKSRIHAGRNLLKKAFKH